MNIVLFLIKIKSLEVDKNMSSLDEYIKNVENAVAELKAALQAAQLSSPSEEVTNQGELTIEQINEEMSIRF